MAGNREEVLEAALQLSEADRLVIVNRLMETLPEEALGLSADDPDLLEELERRLQNSEGSIPWSQLRDEWSAQ